MRECAKAQQLHCVVLGPLSESLPRACKFSYPTVLNTYLFLLENRQLHLVLATFSGKKGPGCDF